jgi:Domain of unknown function (DUF4388)
MSSGSTLGVPAADGQSLEGPDARADIQRMNALQGDLDAFPLEDVMRFLAGAERTGVLRVEAGSYTGRIFFVGGSITFATTRAGDGSVAALRGFSTVPGRDRRGRNPSGKWPRAARPLIMQQVVEVLVRLQRAGRGRFWFIEGIQTKAYGTEEVQRLDVEEALESAVERRAEWDAIKEWVPDGTSEFAIRPLLPAAVDEVTVDATSWQVLSAIGDGASVQTVAERLKLFEFAAAGLIAELVAEGLLVPAGETYDIAEAKVQISVEDPPLGLGELEVRAEDAAG